MRRKSKKSGLERRESARVSADDDFLVEVQKQKFIHVGSNPWCKEVLRGWSKDLSTTGLKFLCTREIPRGTRLKVRIFFRKEFPGIKKAAFICKVTRVNHSKFHREYRIACNIELKTLSRRDTEAITQFLWWRRTFTPVNAGHSAKVAA